jgi:hypothetical protein
MAFRKMMTNLTSDGPDNRMKRFLECQKQKTSSTDLEMYDPFLAMVNLETRITLTLYGIETQVPKHLVSLTLRMFSIDREM